MRDINSMSRENALVQNWRNSVPCTVRLPNKGLAIKGLVVYNDMDLEPLDLLNCMAVGFSQPFPEVWIVFSILPLLKWFNKIIIWYVCMLTMDVIYPSYIIGWPIDYWEKCLLFLIHTYTILTSQSYNRIISFLFAYLSKIKKRQLSCSSEDNL